MKRWFWVFKALAVAGLLVLWWAIWSVDLRVVRKEARKTGVVKSERKREVSDRRARGRKESPAGEPEEAGKDR